MDGDLQRIPKKNGEAAMKQTRWALYIGCAAVAVLVGLLASRLLNDSNTESRNGHTT